MSPWCGGQASRPLDQMDRGPPRYFTNAVHERDQYWALEIAVDRAKVLGVRGKLLHDTGAYTLQDPNIPYNSASTMSGPYAVLGVEVTIALSNKTPVSRCAAPAIRRQPSRWSGCSTWWRVKWLDRRGAAAQPLFRRRRCRTRSRSRPAPAVFVRQRRLSTCQAEALGGLLGRVPGRQAEARASGRYLGIGLAHGVKGTGRGPFQIGLVRISRTAACTIFTGASAMGQGLGTCAGADRGERARRRRVQDQRGGGRHRRRVARIGRLRQPPDRHRRIVGEAWRRPGGGRKGQEGRRARAGGRRARFGIGRRRGARGRRAGAQRQAFQVARILQGAPGLRLSRGVDPGSKAISAPMRCATPTAATSPRSRSMPKPAR